MERFGLRVRIFLFFGLLAGGAIAIAAGALALGWSRADPPMSSLPFVTSFLAFALANTGLVLGIWLLFDDNVAKPINRLSADLRMRVHSNVDASLDTDAARYLGDLAPAAAALSDKAVTSLEDTAAHIARETARLGAERSRLTALLTESPIATILVNPAREIVLYDAQAAAILAEIAVPRLKARLSDYFDENRLRHAFADLKGAKSETSVELQSSNGKSQYSARIKVLGDDGHMIFIDPPETAPANIAQRPLVFDFELMTTGQFTANRDKRLSDLCYVVIDLETTGLSVETDDIVQLAAVRVLNGSLVAGEELSTYVNPGRPIPPTSTRIHHVTDDHVRTAPPIEEAGKTLHHFARDSVLAAHNAPFDIGLLKRHSKALGANWDHPVLDTVLLSAVAFGVTEDHSLDALCERLGIQIPPEERHSALGDARATAEALMLLLKMVEGQGIQTFGALQSELERHARRLYSSF